MRTCTSAPGFAASLPAAHLGRACALPRSPACLLRPPPHARCLRAAAAAGAAARVASHAPRRRRVTGAAAAGDAEPGAEPGIEPDAEPDAERAAEPGAKPGAKPDGEGRYVRKFDPESATDAFGRDPREETRFWMGAAKSVLDSDEVQRAMAEHAAHGGDGRTDEQRAYLEFLDSLDEKAPPQE